MIYLVTGTTGAKKTAFVVTQLEKVEIENKINIVKNAKIYQDNLQILSKKDLLNEITYYLEETGSGDTFKNEVVILDDDYFAMLGVADYDHLRPDDYFKRASEFNKNIERIQELNGDLGLQYFLPVRTIYTNINALKIDYTRALTEDWRDCPDGSLIVIDEIQNIYPYKDTKDKSHPIVTELSIHRHRGFDFYFITQSAGNLHILIKDLVYRHYHITVPFGWKTKIYQYGEFKANPNAKSVKLMAENSFTFSPPPHIFKLYKSTTINTAKSALPIKRMALIFGVVALGLGIGIYGIFFSNDGGVKAPSFEDNAQTSDLQNTGEDIAKVVTANADDKKTDNSNDAKTIETAIGKIPVDALTKEQLQKQLKLQEQHFNQLLEKQRLQLIMQYELMQKQLIEHDEQIKSFYRTLELYKTMLPKNYKELKANPDLQVRGVIKMGNKCKAFNHEGVLMTLNAEQCSYYADEPGRVWKKGQTTDNSPTSPRLPPALTDSNTTTTTAMSNSSGSSNVLTKTPTSDPNAYELNEATKPVEKVEESPAD